MSGIASPGSVSTECLTSLAECACQGDALPSLTRAAEEAWQFGLHAGQRAASLARWMAQADRFRRISPAVCVEDDGQTIRLGDLSPGCQACKEGRWDCLFLSMRCNLSCPFCLTECAPERPHALSAFGQDIQRLGSEYARLGVGGVAFSGGEPTLEFDRLRDGVAGIRAALPGVYLWAYTNGLPLTPERVAALAEAGLNELRFNTAATGYSHPHVNAMLRCAVALLPRVAVEVPAIPEHAAALKAALPFWSQAGVRHLNLHELIHEPGTPSARMPGDRAFCRMPDGHPCEYNPGSADLAAEVLTEVGRRGLPLAVNYCSLSSKARQIQGRRRMLAPLTLGPQERLCDDGLAESVCSYHDALEPLAPVADGRHGPTGLVRVRRLLPLAPRQPGQWIEATVIRKPPVSP